MAVEIFEALRLLEKERGISMDFMLEKIEKAIKTACKNSYDGNENVEVIMDEKSDVFEVNLFKTAIEKPEFPGKEISLEDARKIEKNAEIGDKIKIVLQPKEFGRIAAQTARNIIRQGIKDGEKNQIATEFQSKQHQIVSALIEHVDEKSGAFTLSIGKAESTLPKNEQIGAENLSEGSHIKVYIADVKMSEKGPRIIISRSHPNFVWKIFESEIPEINDGIVEIKSVARDAGSRSKIALISNDPNVDPIGSCIGSRGNRLSTIMEELGGEKIDLIEYSDDPEKFVAAALAPAHVLSVEFNSENSNACVAVVPDNQLSLAIGNRGQNVRLAAKLTGNKIDIRPESGFFGE